MDPLVSALLPARRVDRHHRVVRPGGQGCIANFLRAIELVQHHPGLVAYFLEGHRGHGTILATLVIRPDDSRVRCHFDVLAEERHRLRAVDAEDEAVVASSTDICLVGVALHFTVEVDPAGNIGNPSLVGGSAGDFDASDGRRIMIVDPGSANATLIGTAGPGGRISGDVTFTIDMPCPPDYGKCKR